MNLDRLSQRFLTGCLLLALLLLVAMLLHPPPTP